MRQLNVIRYYLPFPEAIPNSRADCSRVPHPCATALKSKLLKTVRLACLIHAASVRSEPGSNSPIKNSSATSGSFNPNSPSFSIRQARFFKLIYYFFLKRPAPAERPNLSRAHRTIQIFKDHSRRQSPVTLPQNLQKFRSRALRRILRLVSFAALSRSQRRFRIAPQKRAFMSQSSRLPLNPNP